MTTAVQSVREKPILFSGPMVRAILDGRKTQTRRAVKPQPESPLKPWPDASSCICIMDVEASPQYHFECGNVPYGEGMRLWVRETFQKSPDGIVYRASESDAGMGQPDDEPVWRPSIFMPRWASRITLEIVSVRVERLRDISEDDARAEGVEPITSKKIHGWTPHVLEYSLLWDSIKGKTHPWKSNPWVWVIEFRKL